MLVKEGAMGQGHRLSFVTLRESLNGGGHAVKRTRLICVELERDLTEILEVIQIEKLNSFV